MADAAWLHLADVLVLQHDNHIPNLTVGETVDFAHTCHRGYREPEFNLSGELSRAKVRAVLACRMPSMAAGPSYGARKCSWQ